MRLLLVLTSMMLVGCAHDSNFHVVGSVYCETERPEGKAVAKVEFRYSPCAAEHDASRFVTGPKASGANDSQVEIKTPPSKCTTIARAADQPPSVGSLGSSTVDEPGEILKTETKLLNLCQSLLEK